MARSRPAAGEKPLHWAGSSRKDLLGFPGPVTRIRTARTDIRLIEERLKAARNDYEERHGKEADHDRGG